MSWEIPKIDWAASDNPGPSDFNRIEKNTAWLKGQRNIKIPTDGSSLTIELPEGVTSATVTVLVWLAVSLTSGSSGTSGDAYISIGSATSNHISASIGEYSSFGTRAWLAVTVAVSDIFTIVFHSDFTTTDICPIAQVYFE
jgi:hypothetical protein